VSNVSSWYGGAVTALTRLSPGCKTAVDRGEQQIACVLLLMNSTVLRMRTQSTNFIHSTKQEQQSCLFQPHIRIGVLLVSNLECRASAATEWGALRSAQSCTEASAYSASRKACQKRSRSFFLRINGSTVRHRKMSLIEEYWIRRCGSP